MDEKELKTTIDYVPAGKKKAKQYDAIVVEAFKDKHITVEVADVSSFPIKLTWDKSLYSAVSFGNCDFTAVKEVTNVTTGQRTVARRSRSGRPRKQ